MNNYILINTPVAVVMILLLIFFGVGFCVAVFLLQMAADKNKWQSSKIESLKEMLSDREFDIFLLKQGVSEDG